MTQESQVHRYKGMTVGILDENGSVTEYWFRDGIEDDDLIPKIPDIEIPEFPTLDDLLGNLKIAKFNRNGGEGHQNSELTDEESIIRLPQCMFTKSGDEFQGWCEVSDPNEVDEEHPIVQPGSYYPLETSTTFYAMWNQIITYTVSWTSIGHCQITCTANGIPIQNGDAVAAGSTIVFTATPSEGYVFSHWNGLPSSQGVIVDGNVATVPSLSGNILNVSCAVTRVYTVSWTDGDGYTIAVQAGPDSNTLSAINSGDSVESGSYVVFTCTTDNGYTFIGWNGLSGDNPVAVVQSLGSNLTNISCNVGQNFGIRFSPNPSHGYYTVTVNNGTPTVVNGVNGPWEASVPQGTSVVIDYIPTDTGYSASPWFVEYGDSAVYTESQNTLSFTMPGHPLKIYVEETDSTVYYTVTVLANNNSYGEVSGGGPYTSGESVTVTATAHNGYHFSYWTDGEDTVSSNAEYTFIASENITLTAVFEPNTYTISASPNNSEYGGTTGGGTYEYNATATVTATANPGYKFERWTENGSYVSDSATYQFVVQSNHSFVAEFSQLQTYTVTTSVSPSGSGNTTGDNTYYQGATATVTATAASGYHFVNWTENGNSVWANPSYSFTVSANRVLVANFEADAPDTVNVIGVSGAKKYAKTLQDKITSEASDPNSEFCREITANIGGTNEVMRSVAYAHDGGYTVLVPDGYRVDSIRLYYADNSEYVYGGSTVQTSLPRSNDDATTMVSKLIYNDVEYNFYTLYVQGSTPTKATFVVVRNQ